MASYGSASGPLLNSVHSVSVAGNRISLTMISFLDNVRDQPLGFRDLGRDFLSISQILNDLQKSLNEHFNTGQPFPERAIPELMRVVNNTSMDFGELERLLNKFMEYEKGGMVAQLQKTWRHFFADRDIAKVQKSIREQRGSLNMAMLLTNINPALSQPLPDEYKVLEAKLEQSGPPAQYPEGGQPQPYYGSASPPAQTPWTPGAQPWAPPAHPMGPPPGHDVRYPPAHPAGPPPDAMGYAHLTGPPPGHTLGYAPAYPAVPPPEHAIGYGQYHPAGPPPHHATGYAPYHPPTPASAGYLPSPPPGPPPGPAANLPGPPGYPGYQGHTQSYAPAPHPPGPPPVDAMQNMSLSDQKQPISPEQPKAPEHVSAATPPVVSPVATTPVPVAPVPSLPVATAASLPSAPAPVELEAPQAIVPPVRQAIKVDRSTIQFRQPKLTVGAGNAALQKALFSAVQGKKQAIVEQLLDRGVSPNGGPDAHPLWQAVHNRLVPIVKLLLEFGADPNIPNGTTPPLELAAEGRLEEATLLLQFGANPNPKDAEFPPLRNAIGRNHTDIVKALLQYGADPKSKWKDGDCPIVWASWRNTLPEIVEELLSWGADVEMKHENGATALEGPCTHGYANLAKVLLAHGSDPNVNGQHWPLDQALRHPEVLALLLGTGADWKKCPDILEFSVVRNCIDSTKLLLDHGMPVDTKHHDGYSPLGSALRDGRNKIVHLLLASGADPNMKGNGYPLENARRNPEGLRAIIAAGADWKLCPQILEFSVVTNELESVKILVEEAHMPVDTKHPEGYSPLGSGLRDRRVAAVEYLLSKGADPNMVGNGLPLENALRCPEGLEAIIKAGADWKKCQHILELASAWGELDAVKILVEVAGMPPNTRHPSGYSPVTSACRDGRIPVLQYLLSKGADPNMEGDGFPIMNALRNPQALEILLDAGADPKKITGVVEPAVVRAPLESVKLLIEKGHASPNEPYDTHYYPVGSAIRETRPKYLDYLLQHGGDPNSIGPYVPLVQAARKPQPDFVRLLLAAGAAPDKPDVDGNVALVEAACHGRIENVKLLLEHNANPNVANVNGVGPMDAAANQGHEDIVMLLLEHM